MKKLNSSKLAIPRNRILFFEAVLRLCKQFYGDAWTSEGNYDWLRTYKEGKSRRLRQVYRKKNKYALKSIIKKQSQVNIIDNSNLEELYKNARQKFIELISKGIIQGRIEIHDRPALTLNNNLVHLVYCQLHTVCGTNYLRTVVDGDIVYGLVTFDEEHLNEVFKSKHLRDEGERGISDRDREEFRALRSEMEGYVENHYPPPHKGRPTVTDERWLEYKRQVMEWLKAHNGGLQKTISISTYRNLIRETFEGSDLRAGRGRKNKDALLSATKLFDHFFGKYEETQEVDDEEITSN